ncbi:MAG TPA: hypothetical protein VLV17_09690 [Anaeromyxobacteraceae bacterium]|nr:hypothetical protein [Anaeromyxobacteraceae bacterium]
MTLCERFRASAPGLAALPPDDPERLAASAHAETCAECRKALLEGERLEALLALAGSSEVSASPSGAAYLSIKRDLEREGRRRVLGSIVAIGAALVLLVTLAHERSHAPSDLALAAGLALAAFGLATQASRFTLGAATAAVIAALAAALLGGKGGPLEAAAGLDCLASELVAAAAVLCAVRLAVRGGATFPQYGAFAAGAAAGALAADAALEVTCGAHGSLPHVLSFHVGGVVLALALARLALRRRARPEAAGA